MHVQYSWAQSSLSLTMALALASKTIGLGLRPCCPQTHPWSSSRPPSISGHFSHKMGRISLPHRLPRVSRVRAVGLRSSRPCGRCVVVQSPFLVSEMSCQRIGCKRVGLSANCPVTIQLYLLQNY